MVLMCAEKKLTWQYFRLHTEQVFNFFIQIFYLCFCFSVMKTLDRIGGVMISLLASIVLDREFDLVQSNQRLQNWYLLVSRLAVLKGTYRLVGLMCLSEETMRTLDLCNRNPSVVCWSGTKLTSSLLFSHDGIHLFTYWVAYISRHIDLCFLPFFMQFLPSI